MHITQLGVVKCLNLLGSEFKFRFKFVNRNNQPASNEIMTV